MINSGVDGIDCVRHAAASAHVSKKCVYGSTGAALLRAVYHPRIERVGLIVIQGSGWYMPQRYDVPALKDDPFVAEYGRRFAEAGYTAFVINHRTSPRFRYPAALEDAQRAVRFIRHNASSFGIDGRRLGAWGASSGGHLATLLGTLDGTGDPNDSDPVNRESAKVQTVAVLFPATDLTSFKSALGTPYVVMFMGFAYPILPLDLRACSGRKTRIQAYREASPTTHVTREMRLSC